MKLQKHITNIFATLGVISLTAMSYAAIDTATSGGTLTATMWNNMKSTVDANTAKLTNFTIDGTKVGIGLTPEGDVLEVNGHVRVKSGVRLNDADGQDGDKWGIYGWNDYLTFSLRNSDWTWSSSPLVIKNTGNVGINTVSPTEKLDVNGKFIRSIYRATGTGPNDGTDNGQITSRVLNFTKTQAGTSLRIGRTDARRVYYGTSTQGGYACTYEIKIDGISCTTPLKWDFYKLATASNQHRPAHLVGYCDGISAGSHQVQVFVSQKIAGSDCYVGWDTSNWTIELEEVY